MTPKSFQILIIALVFAVPGVDSPVGADEKAPVAQLAPGHHLLRYKFHEGEQLRYESSQKVTQQAVAPGGQKVDVSKVEQRRLFRIGDVKDDGEASVSMQFEHVRMETQSDDRDPTVFESSMKDSEVPKIFRAAAHKLKGAAPIYSIQSTGTSISKDGYRGS